MREKAGKRVWILAVLFCLGLCMAVSQPKGWVTVQAKEQSAEQTGKWTGMGTLASRGNLLYQDSGERVGIFTADFSLLQEKLSSVPEAVFDPTAYGNGSISDQEGGENL